MSIRRAIYETSRVILGTGHLAFTLAAEACVEAEWQITKKTGWYNPESNSMEEVLPGDKYAFKSRRREITNELLDSVAQKAISMAEHQSFV